jgi:hypothetical protein
MFSYTGHSVPFLPPHTPLRQMLPPVARSYSAGDSRM